MKLSELLLPEFDREMAHTRKCLERLPEDKLDWRPHPRSWTMGELTTHIVHLPTWGMETLRNDALNMTPPEGEQLPRPQLIQSSGEALTRFDRNVAEVRRLLETASDEHLLASWTLLDGDRTIFVMPRIAVLRTFFMNHIIHHRAQLGVYLRMNEVSLPALYGPSADEAPL